MTAKKQEPRDVRMSDGSVCLAGKAVHYTLKTSQRAKNLRLYIDLENGLMVTVPEKYDPGSLDQVLIEKQGWILNKLAYFAELQADLAAAGIKPGKNILYRGREYQVEVQAKKTAACNVEIEEGKMVVMLDEGSGKDSAVVLERWLKSMARLLINQRIRVVNNVLNLHFNRVAIRGQKTRWGSCSRLGNLNFNWRLVMAPLPVMDYVVVHELLHLVEPNHSKKFWDLVENVCPDYKDSRDWLKKNGHRLKI